MFGGMCLIDPVGAAAISLPLEKTEGLDQQAMAAHESPRTTKLDDRSGDEITFDAGQVD
jgi:hypothetical protein